MSKIQNIKRLVAEGKGNQKMLEYLLWYSDSLALENIVRERIAKTTPLAESLEYTSLLATIQHQRKLVDLGEITPEEYFLVVSKHHKFKSI